MLTNFFKTAWRTLLRYKDYTLINTLGLTLGITGAILIFLLVKFHLSFDTYHRQATAIHRLVTEFHFDGITRNPGVPRPLGPALRQDFPQLKYVTTIQGAGDVTVAIPNAQGSMPKKFKENNALCFVEPTFFDIFDYTLLQGDNRHAFKQPNTVLITKDLAEKYFGTSNALGKIIRIDAKIDLKIVGILDKLPNNTDLRYTIFGSWLSQSGYFSRYKEDAQHWGGVSSSTNCFFVLPENFSAQQLQKQLLGFRKKHHGNDYKIYNYQVQALKDRHFDDRYDGNAPYEVLIGLGLVGIFLIITACINFVNLATAQALKRSKEVGVRKVLGSTKTQLFWQFMLETAFITLVASVLATIGAKLAFEPMNAWFDDISGYQMAFYDLFDAKTLLAIVALTLLIVLCAGFYPAIVLSGFNPITALKGKVNTQHVGGISIRKGLVVTQFMISQLLIIFMTVISTQMAFFRQTDLGFNRDAILQLPLPTNDKSAMENLKNTLAQQSDIQALSFQFSAPSSSNNNTTNFRFDTRQKDEIFQVNTRTADDQYCKLYDLKLLAGRNIALSDTAKEALINETLVKKLGLKTPEEAVGKRIQVWGKWMIISGVIKDFHVTSLRDEIPSTVIFSTLGSYYSIGVKVNLASLKRALPSIEKAWSKAYPDYVFEYEFLDKSIAKFYSLEEAMLTLIRVFSGIAIIIGCLGLYGLVSFMVTQKTKEIGVRKVLGASVGQILWLFGKEFSQLILLAFLIAAPFGGWLMHSWLQNFTYRIGLSVSVFAWALICTTIIAMLTVSYQAIRAALTNPVKSLKTE